MRILLAEFLGTFALVFTGCGAVVADEFSGGAVGHAGISLTFGLIVMAVVYALGDISGAHINPAVTVGFWASGRFPGKLVIPYIAVQCLGAVAACGFLRWLCPDVSSLGETLPKVGVLRSFALEIALTALLFFVILHVATGAKEKGLMAGVAIGGTVALEALFAGTLCGASMNPARSTGPAVANGNVKDLWLYWAAPLLGSLLAIALFRATEKEE
jgi:aquaporin Z